MSAVLDRVNVPADLETLSEAELETLASELRVTIIDTVSKTGGHLAANLGVVEITIALLRVFAPPEDKIIWDTSHQCYAWKLLTGRKDRFDTLRQHQGLSGFLKRDESEYDAFGAGHAGTALSAALGMAVARDRRKGKEHVVAVVGDAAAGNGISLEALNNVAGSTGRLIVILNDNEMSIAENVGSISQYLGNLLANPRYNRWKRSVESVASRLHMGWARSVYYRLEEAIKSLFLRSVIFEEFGLRYVGPINGHNIHALTDALTIARDSKKPILLHVSTRKGQGYAFAEEQPAEWHGTSCFDISTGKAVKKKGPSWSSVFGEAIERLASDNDRIVAITAAMCSGTGLDGMAERFPNRFFDVGISEEHAAVFAAGLATEGIIPVFAVYSTFAQRAVDCILHDICLQGLHVVICLDRAGIVGDDGPTHHGVFDIALLRPLPDLVFMQPRDEAELANMLHTAVRTRGPVVIRYPRGRGPGTPIPGELAEIEIGKADVLREGGDVSLWALGDMIPPALDAADTLASRGIETGVVNARFIKPIDKELLLQQARQVKVIATLENGVVTGGFGSGIRELLSSEGLTVPVVAFGWPDAFVPHGSPATLMVQYGLTAEAVAERIMHMLGKRGGA